MIGSVSRLGYLEQYERMMRWYDKFKEIFKKFEKNDEIKNIDAYYDIVYTFFQNCYHLKDWIKNDDNILISNKVVEDYITKNKYLSICADICNGIKHLKLNNPRSDEEVKPVGYSANWQSNNSGWVPEIEFYIITTSGYLDAFELATECVRKWDHFIDIYIKKKKLVPVV